MSITEICVLAIVGAVALALIKNHTAATSVVLRLAVIVVLFMGIAPTMQELIDALNGFSFVEGLSKESISVMLKVFAVLTLGAVTADICRDNGEGSLAGVVELSSRLIAVGISLPVITSVITVATSFFR